MRVKTNRRLIVILIVSIFIITNCSVVTNAVDNVIFRNITIEDGLSQATVETMIQDKKGYIWIGTNDGLNRYNGYNFNVYKHEKNNSNSIINNYITDLKEDLQGNIWVGTGGGLSKISSTGGEITNYIDQADKGNLSHHNIWDILILKNGDVLVATEDGLNIYNEQTDSFERILNNGEISNQLVHSLDEDDYGNVWIGTGEGLNKLSLETRTVETFYHSDEENSIEENKIYEVYCDGDYVWIGTFTKGASRLNIKTGEIKNFFEKSWGLESMPGGHIRNFFRDSNNIMWISSNNGLVKYNDTVDKFEIYKNKIHDKRSLIDDNIFGVMEDRSGTLWVCTYAGISIFNSSNSIVYYNHDPFNKNTINSNMVQGIYEDDEGYLWVGTNSKGVNILDKDRNNIATITTSNNNSLSSDRVNDIVGYDSYIFLGTDNGLIIIDKEKNTIKTIDNSDGLVCKDIRNLYVDRDQQLWVGTTDGFDIVNIETDEIININYILQQVNAKDRHSGAIFQDTEGVYWLGSFMGGGLTKIDPNNKSVINYKKDESNENSIADNAIRTIEEDSKGNIWVGTSGGLCLIDTKNDTIKTFTTEDGLPNNTIYGILIDEQDNPWVSTNLGISMYDVENDKFVNLNLTDGLQSNEFNGESYLKTKDGEFFFGGINGMNSFYPGDLKENNYIPQVVFDEFYVNGLKVNNIDGNEYSHDENNISIQVFLPDYKNSKNIRYYYKLDGIDKDWRLMDTTEVLFSNLSPGSYTFKVMAVNGKGMRSEENKVSFKINTPIWISLPAMIVYIFIILFVYIRNRYKVKRLDSLVDKKTKELRNEMNKNNDLFGKVIELERNKNSYFINLSHELRTPLNVLHTTEQLITKLNNEDEIKKDKLDYYMMVIRKNNKRLLKLINNLIDISKIEHGNYQIKFEDVDIVYLVEETTLGLKDYVEDKGIEIIIDPEIEEKIIRCDSQEIERCIVNLISNAIKFTPKGGTINVIIEDLDRNVKITVSDTGCGIDPMYHEAIFSRFDQVVDQNSEVKGGSGLGLTITKQIVELHKGMIYVESELGIGSKFNIILPVNLD